MSVPRARLLPVSPGIVPRWSQAGGRIFRVLAEGRALGLYPRRGDLLFVGGAPGEEDLVVAVPRGYGKPQIARVSSEGLLGERQLPAEHWTAAGALVAMARYFRVPLHSGQVLRSGAPTAPPSYPDLEPTGRWVVIDAGRPLPPKAECYLREGDRCSAVHIRGEMIFCQIPWVFSDIIEGDRALNMRMTCAGALLAELRSRFSMRPAIGVSRNLAAATAAAALVQPSAILVIEDTAVAVETFLGALPAVCASQQPMFRSAPGARP